MVNNFLGAQKLPVTLCSCIFITKYNPFYRELTFFESIHWRVHFWVNIPWFTMSRCRMSFFPIVCTLKLICCTFSESLLHIFHLLSLYCTNCPSFYIVLKNLKQFLSLLYVLFLEKEYHISCYSFLKYNIKYFGVL